MNRKTIIALIITSIVGIAMVFGFRNFKNYSYSVKDEHCLSTQISSRIFDFNTFDLKVDSNLDISDFKVVHINTGNSIFINGKNKKGIENEYGHRIFALYYLGRKEYEFGHFITNNWVTNNYKLQLKETNGRIETDVEITGVNASYSDFFYKRFEYDEMGELERISYLSLGKEVYNTEEIN